MASQLSYVEDSNAKSSYDIIWLVIDSRTAQYGVVSGISRFVIGLTTALVRELNVRKQEIFQNNKKLLILVP